MTAALLSHELSVADALEDAASRWDEGDPVPAIVRRLASPSLGADLEGCWAEFAARMDERDALATRRLTWREVCPELTCWDRDGVALQLACEAADDARAVLQFGTRGE
jgi:hypothetical protein